jgi:CDP-glucose 4,6-dehydratase
MDLTLGARLRGLPGPILVTGHTGFKGTWLTFLLEHLQVPVIGFSLPPEKDSLFNRAKRQDVIPEEFADIRNLEAVSKFISKHKPSAIIHMAAQPLVLESYKTPRETFETNVMGTVNVFDSAFKNSSVEAIVAITTDKVYRNDNSGSSFVESDALSGKDPYSASKVGAESVVAAWQQISKATGGPKIISVRAGNVIGGGDWADSRLLPDLIRSFISGETINLRSPQSTRPWQHVLDPLIGYLLALDAIRNGQEIASLNFGPIEDSLTVRQVFEIASSSWGAKINLSAESPEIYNSIQLEALEIGLNSSLAKELLDWKPYWSQVDAVTATTTWWKKTLLGHRDAERACLEDITQILSDPS